MDMFSSYFASFSNFVLFSGLIPEISMPILFMSWLELFPGKTNWLVRKIDQECLKYKVMAGLCLSKERIVYCSRTLIRES